jgi:uncharacterized protein YcbX
MIRVERLYFSPVKSLALVELGEARLDKPGIAGDRAFFIIDEQGELVTQRGVASLVQVRPSYDTTSGELGLIFPDGQCVCGVPELGETVSATFFAQDVEGRLVLGDWNDSLSQFARQQLRLVKTARAGSSFDAFPPLDVLPRVRSTRWREPPAGQKWTAAASGRTCI